MIAHQHKGVDAPAGPGARLPERFQKPPPIRVVLENRFTPVPAVENVIDGSLKFDACFAGHGFADFYSSSFTEQEPSVEFPSMRDSRSVRPRSSGAQSTLYFL